MTFLEFAQLAAFQHQRLAIDGGEQNGRPEKLLPEASSTKNIFRRGVLF